jgi:hypothetical protein
MYRIRKMNVCRIITEKLGVDTPQYQALWQNLCIAGGSILNAIIDNRETTDVDLFIYGLNEAEANQKIRDIIQLFDTKSNVQRTANAITIRLGCARPVQIILRLYKTLSEVIHGFDVDCCCVAYDGTNVWMTKRAEYSIRNLVNVVDFERMSPSYEFRLAKYMRRGFSVYIPDFDMSKVDMKSVMKYCRPRETKELRGLDVLLYGYLHVIKKNTMISDYEHGIPGHYTVKIDDVRFLLDNDFEVYGYCTANDIRLADISDIKDLDAKIAEALKEEYDLNKTHKFGISLKMQWKAINPGEQATGTFHKIVLKDISEWYKGKYYKYQ